MKKLLFLLILFSISSFGQQKVYQRDKFEANKKFEKIIVNTYPNLAIINVQGRQMTGSVFDVDTRK